MSTDIDSPTAEYLANQFVDYLFEEYQESNHVRRVATWIGFLLVAIEDVSDDLVGRKTSRQLKFTYRDQRFKVRYDHGIGNRGGIEIIEILPGRGEPDGEVVAKIASLEEAEEVYQTLPKILDEFVN